MKITTEMINLAAREITADELDKLGEQEELNKFTRNRATDVLSCGLSLEFRNIPLVDILQEQINIAVLVGIKIGKKEAITELSQVR